MRNRPRRRLLVVLLLWFRGQMHELSPYAVQKKKEIQRNENCADQAADDPRGSWHRERERTNERKSLVPH